MATGYLLSWTEFERGWGQRPDGYSLHATPEGCAQYLKDFYGRRKPGPAPDEYEEPDSQTPRAVEISEELGTALGHACKDNGGVRLWRNDVIIAKAKSGRDAVALDARVLGPLLAAAEKAALEEAAQAAPAAPKRAM